MKHSLLTLGIIAAIGWASPSGMAAEPRVPLKVVYLGNEGTPRAAEFVDFLRTRFEQVGERKRDDLDLESVGAFDVVLLDWSQSDTPLEKAVSPLGPRADWSKPTVLFGIAGLLLATSWDTIGGAG